MSYSEDDRYADDFEEDSDSNAQSEVCDANAQSDVDNEISDDEITDVGNTKMTLPSSMKTSATNFTRLTTYKSITRDLLPYDSSSENDEDVVIGHTIAEINTRPMNLDEATSEVRDEIMKIISENQAALEQSMEKLRITGGEERKISDDEDNVDEDEEDDDDDEVDDETEALTYIRNNKDSLAKQLSRKHSLVDDSDEDKDQTKLTTKHGRNSVNEQYKIQDKLQTNAVGSSDSEDYELDDDEEDEGGHSDNAELYDLGNDDDDDNDEDDLDEDEDGEAKDYSEGSETEQLLDDDDEYEEDDDEGDQTDSDAPPNEQTQQQKFTADRLKPSSSGTTLTATPSVEHVTNILENALLREKPLGVNEVEGMIAALNMLKRNFAAEQQTDGGGDCGSDTQAAKKNEKLQAKPNGLEEQKSREIPKPTSSKSASHIPRLSASTNTINRRTISETESAPNCSITKASKGAGKCASDTNCMKRRRSDLDTSSTSSSKLDCRIDSRTPTSFTSERHMMHMNIIKHRHSEPIGNGRGPQRKSFSFSNERMREIERHNMILLRKIESQKPTYKFANGKKSRTNTGPSPNSAARISSAAVNRKKQQRQIDIDNQQLKRKLEAINYRRTVF